MRRYIPGACLLVADRPQTPVKGAVKKVPPPRKKVAAVSKKRGSRYGFVI